MNQTALNATEKRASISLAMVFGLRMLGLFMIMPVFAYYGQSLEGYSPLWVGLAIGAYGLTQALFQIPMGILSDRIGRKPVIVMGLLIFALGSLIAAWSDSVYGVALGRAIQGLGAIASAILALAADTSREEQRSKVMATIGVSIGLAFAVAMVVGPIVTQFIGLAGLFYFTAVMALLGIVIVRFSVPNVTHKAPPGDTVATPRLLKSLLAKPELLRLDAGIFILHLTLTAMFVVLPLKLVAAGMLVEHHWMLYFPALILSFLFIVPMLIYGARKQKNKQLFIFSIMLMALSLLLLALQQSPLWLILLAVFLYFTAFNFLEASLPAFISMLAPAGAKGTAMGVYSTSQFLGAFLGGVLGGYAYNYFGDQGLFILIAGLMLCWMVIALGMSNPSQIRNHVFSVDLSDSQRAQVLTQQLAKLQGVLEAVVVVEEHAVYLKVKHTEFELNQAQVLINSGN
ncbi:MFS transporter [Motilimonas eburnea]|uniref:MFS transporter n=1 Tax=Motilimonas eburnea TaxID=1737488 RepID=UPI001E5D828B|nr:MFS transporter [Motilimonas eburnea]MCE2572288.1 MFS transporter [Motilimonas eburnea]